MLIPKFQGKAVFYYTSYISRTNFIFDRIFYTLPFCDCSFFFIRLKTYLENSKPPRKHGFHNYILTNIVSIKLEQNHIAPGIHRNWLYKLLFISYANVIKVYRDDIEFKTQNRQKTQKEAKLVYQKYE